MDVLALGDVLAVVMALVNGDVKALVRVAAKVLVEAPVGEVVIVAAKMVAMVIVEVRVVVPAAVRALMEVNEFVGGCQVKVIVDFSDFFYVLCL